MRIYGQLLHISCPRRNGNLWIADIAARLEVPGESQETIAIKVRDVVRIFPCLFRRVFFDDLGHAVAAHIIEEGEVGTWIAIGIEGDASNLAVYIPLDLLDALYLI